MNLVMEQEINWLKVITIMGLAFTLVGVYFIFTAYTLFNDDFEYLVSLTVKKAVVESVIGVLLFLTIAKYTSIADIKKVLRSLAPHIVVVTIFLVGGIVAGYFLQDTLQGIMSGYFEEIAKEAEKFQSIPTYQQAFFLFGNNSRVAVIVGIMAFFPVLGTFIPLGVMGLNGAVIGFAPAVLDMEWSTFLLAILPHGVLEVPALVLASAVGVKFSICSLKAVLGYFFHPRDVSGRAVFLREIGPGWQSVKLFVVIIPLLVAAAFIEAFITPYVMGLIGI